MAPLLEIGEIATDSYIVLLCAVCLRCRDTVFGYEILAFRQVHANGIL